jgi:tetraacyldisaccharide 4'-kinase
VRLIEQLWTDGSAAGRIGRAMLTPFELAYGGVIRVRNNLYDNAILTSHESRIPVVSVGNLTVGGTGKTPIAAWIARRLRDRGKTPAIVLRGYGDDEPLVHRHTNPDVPVIVAADRAAGIDEAVANGANVVVLDDAFQHRRAGRTIDVVLISADDWSGSPRLLPAGPFREPLSGLRRASMVIITRKSASDQQVAAVHAAIRSSGSSAAVAVASLELAELVRDKDVSDSQPVAALREKTVLAIAAVGNPQAFFAQLRAYTPLLTPVTFPDHHAFTDGEIADLVSRGRDVKYVVCTLKDAVKLRSRWPADAVPLWYVSLAVRIEQGAESISELLLRL